jgi:hypothetical protein
LCRCFLFLVTVGTRPHKPNSSTPPPNHNKRHTLTTTGFTFPYLFDATQEVALQYKAACTPEFYVFDADNRLAYHGQFDSSRPNNNALVTGVWVGLGG